MSSITIIDKYTLKCSKALWTPEDRFLASCLDIKDSGKEHLIDIRVVSRKAFAYYLEKVFPYIYSHPDSKAYRTALFNNLKVMYKVVYNDFMTSYYPKVGYTKSVGRDLYKHQKTTLATIINRRFNLLALEQGTGKTLIGATLSKVTGAKRTVIICPNLVKWSFFEDMTTVWGYNPLYWTILDSKSNKSIRAFRERFVILNFEQVKKQMHHLMSDQIDHIIIDECHYIKNPKSNRAKAIAELIEAAGKPRVTMMTGTPVTNRINDMFSYLKISGHPLGNNFEAFKRKYTITASVRGGKIIGAQNIADLKGKVSNLMIRILSEDCLDLPDMIIKNYYFEPEEISTEYKEELEHLKEKKEKYDSLHGTEKFKMNSEIKANIHTLNRIVTTSKVPKIKELIDHLVDQGEKVVVFAGYKAPLAKLEELLGKSCVKIDGSVDSHKRQQLINRFKNDDHCKVFLANMVAGGIGINLVNSRNVIFMNFPFVPAEIEQAQKRLHRGGQTSKVNVYYTIAKGTIDEHIYSLVADKSKDINMLVDGNEDGVVNYGNLTSQLFRKLLE